MAGIGDPSEVNRSVTSSGSADEVEMARGDVPGVRASSRFIVEEYIEMHNDEVVRIVTGLNRPSFRSALLNKLTTGLHEAHWAAQCISIWISTALTFAYANEGRQVGGNLAQATVVTLGCLAAPQLSAPVAMGAYMGVGSKLLIPDYEWLALLSLLGCGSWLLVSKCHLFVGFAGRIGFTAFCTCHILQAIVVMPSGAVAWHHYGNAAELWDTRLTWQGATASLIAPVVVAVLAKLLRDNGRSLENPIAGATVAALPCFILLSLTNWGWTEAAMNGVGVGSFVGMASTEKLRTTAAFAGTGLLAGCFTLLLEPFFLGWAGRQGTCAFLGFCAALVLETICCAVAGLLRKHKCPSSDSSSEDSAQP